MKVFEDLLVELKDENLLEETVDLLPRSNGNGKGSVKAGKPLSNGNGNGHKNGSTQKEKSTERLATRTASVGKNPSDQLSALQLVDFVVSAAERLDGGAGLPFDDLLVQKAFHRYTQAGNDPENEEEFREAEDALNDSLRSWDEDLVKRDSVLPVGTLRRYTESANPPLSPQALFALVRFYRSVPVSESAFLKFDFVVTRLFSKFVDGDRRDMLCSRSDVVKHLNHRYSEWGMNAFKSIPTDDPDIALICLSFEDFAAESENALSISSLADAKLFERLNEFKRNSGAMLYVPIVTAAAIESNLRISRKLYDLAGDEAGRGGGDAVSDIDPELISNAIARTFETQRSEENTKRNPTIAISDVPTSSKPPKPGKAYRAGRSRRSNLFGINPWLLTATILSVVISAGIYVWAQYYTDEPAKASTSARVVDIENPDFKQFIKSSKVTNDMLHAVVTPEYSQLTQDKRRDIIQKVRGLGETKGYRRVTFYNAEGKAIAYASADRTDIH